MTIKLTKEEADILNQDISEALDRLRNQKEDLEACVEFFRNQSEKDSADQAGIIIKGLESDILFTQELIDVYQKDLQELQTEKKRVNCTDTIPRDPLKEK